MFRNATNIGYPISDQMIISAEKCLVECISKNSESENFDDLNFKTYD